MKHYLYNVTWRCPNRCPYCWVRQSVGLRLPLVRAQEGDLSHWVRATKRDMPDVVDIAGGEPLLLPWLSSLILSFPTIGFGLSTNGLPLRALHSLCALRPPNLVAVNLSYHPYTAEWMPDYDDRYKRAVDVALVLGRRLHVNIVDFGEAWERSAPMRAWLAQMGVKVDRSPYEQVGALGKKLSLGLLCKGGESHLTIAPDGEAWPCLTSLRSPYWEQYRLGNWFEGKVDVGRKPQPCYLSCVDYYVLPHEHEAGDMWGIEAHPVAEGG